MLRMQSKTAYTNNTVCLQLVQIECSPRAGDSRAIVTHGHGMITVDGAVDSHFVLAVWYACQQDRRAHRNHRLGSQARPLVVNRHELVSERLNLNMKGCMTIPGMSQPEPVPVAWGELGCLRRCCLSTLEPVAVATAASNSGDSAAIGW